MRACRHADVPIGGTLGGLTGAIDGPAIGQMRGGQIGRISSALLHSGCISPSTHWQVQSASARVLISTAIPAAKPIKTRFMNSSACRPAPAAAPPLEASDVHSGLTFVHYMFS